MKENIIEFVNITKKFGNIIANDAINMKVKKGSIHAIIGENGAGKSTLMSVLFGIYQPDGGHIKINGKPVSIKGPKIAASLGVGMVHQHFKLVQIFDAVQNIILGHEDKSLGLKTKISEPRKKIEKLSKLYNLDIDTKMKVKDMPIGMQQRVEILKMLYSDAEVLIFDEPTAVLSPKEIEGFLSLLENFKKKGKTIILITHKLEEIKTVADTATIIKRGTVVESCDVATTSIKKMAEAMVGKEIVKVKNKFTDASKNKKILEVKNLNYIDKKTKKAKVNNINFDIYKGEIVAIAGVEGNGQNELSLLLSGMLKPTSGTVIFDNKNITKSSIRRRNELGMSHIPEDRHKHGLILDMSITDNMSSQMFYKFPFSNFGILNNRNMSDFAIEIINEFDVRGANSGNSIARSLSGGNQQKAIVGRELKKKHKLVIAVQPTRGLDLGAISNIHDELIKEKKKNNAVILISYELHEVMALADRIIVFNDGFITGIIKAKGITKNKIGELMVARLGKELKDD